MDKQQMTNLLEKLRRSESIYDVATAIHQAVTTQNENKNWTQYTHFMRGKLTHSLQKELETIIQIMCGNPVNDFQPARDELILLLSQEEAPAVPLLVLSLFLFDKEFTGFQNNRRHVLLPCGPLNGSGSQKDTQANLYLLAKDCLQSRFMQKHKLYTGRTVFHAHPSGINSKLKSYTVIPHNQLGGFTPNVWEYCFSEADTEALRNGPLRISVFPLGNQRWFRDASTEDEELFNIEYLEQANDSLFNSYRRALEFAEKKKVDIAVFPELGLGDSILKRVQDYLQETMFKRKYLKLVFCGSEWVNCENKAYVLTATGKVLLTQMKRESVEPYDKKRSITRRENLKDHDGNLTMLDIVGLGRIAYSVCRDYIDPQQTTILADHLRSGILVASCFTPRIGPFQTTAEGMASSYCSVSMICNSCADIIRNGATKGSAIGFLTVPVCEEKTGKERVIHGISKSYCILDQECLTNDCKMRGCAAIYTLSYSKQHPETIDVAIAHENLPAD